MSSNNGTISNGKGPALKLTSKQKITDEYILYSTTNNQEQAQLAIALSSYEIQHYDVISKAKTLSFKGHQKSVTGIKYSEKEPNILFSSSLDGNLYTWDTRSGVKPVQTFSDDTDSPCKPFLCFDFNASESYICAGTELIREDSFIIFWDRRSSNSLGGYWNSHTDEITHVQFHSSSDSGLASSSVDGLINLFDLNESSEDDALSNTLNTGTSVRKFVWGASDQISCITGTEEYQLWFAEKTSPCLSISRKDLSDKSKCDVDYLIDTFNLDSSFYLASGSNKGGMQLFSCKKKGIKLAGLFDKGHTDVVRTVCYNQGGCLISGGEDGQLCTWEISL